MPVHIYLLKPLTYIITQYSCLSQLFSLMLYAYCFLYPILFHKASQIPPPLPFDGLYTLNLQFPAVHLPKLTFSSARTILHYNSQRCISLKSAFSSARTFFHHNSQRCIFLKLTFSSARAILRQNFQRCISLKLTFSSARTILTHNFRRCISLKSALSSARAILPPIPTLPPTIGNKSRKTAKEPAVQCRQETKLLKLCRLKLCRLKLCRLKLWQYYFTHISLETCYVLILYIF